MYECIYCHLQVDDIPVWKEKECLANRDQHRFSKMSSSTGTTKNCQECEYSRVSDDLSNLRCVVSEYNKECPSPLRRNPDE